jgi:hypothetical protein
MITVHKEIQGNRKENTTDDVGTECEKEKREACFPLKGNKNNEKDKAHLVAETKVVQERVREEAIRIL